jgi:hypothetical protein
MLKTNKKRSRFGVARHNVRVGKVAMSSELEKFRLAKEWLNSNPRGTQEWEAAYEHLVWVAKNTTDTGIKAECRAVLEKVMSKPPRTRRDR